MSPIFEPLPLEGLILIKPQVFADKRGFFLERYNKKLFKENGIDVDFVQDNHSRSSKGVLRGLHFQKPPFAQDKLVWVANGEVLDVVVDIRSDSPSFGKWQSQKLSETNKYMLFIPKGFAHGFLTLTKTADFFYKVSNFYSKEHDDGILWNDSDIGIDWKIKNPIISEKDKKLKKLKDLGKIF